MANWAFEIDVADDYVVGLTERLTDKGFRVWCFHNVDQPVYLFSSAYLSAVAAEEVFVQARQLVKFIDGVSYLLFENKEHVHRIVLNRVIDVDTFSVVSVPRNGEVGEIDFSLYRAGVMEDEDPVARLLKLVAVDEFIRALLLVLSEGMDQKNLKKVYNLVAERDGGSLPVLRESLKEGQEQVTEMIFKVLEKKYGLYLKACVVRDSAAGAGDWYDSLYD